MESTLQLKHSLMATIGSINDRDLIVAITEFIKKRAGRVTASSQSERPAVDVAPEVWNIVRRIHPVDVTDEKKEYNEYLNKKYE